MAKKGYRTERERQLVLEKEGYHVLRVSGSIGAMDLIAVKQEISSFIVFYEQVKSTKKDTFYFNERSRDELRRLKEIKKRYGIPCKWSVKFKRKGWKVYNAADLNGSPLKLKEK